MAEAHAHMDGEEVHAHAHADAHMDVECNKRKKPEEDEYDWDVDEELKEEEEMAAAPSEPKRPRVWLQPCLHPNGCSTMASFNLPGQITLIRCSKHKEPAMVNLRRKGKHHVPRKNKTQFSMLCRDPSGCQTKSSFNMPDVTPAIRCLEHKLPGMVNVREQSLCKEPDCTTYPCFGVPDTKTRLYCFEHKKAGMVDLAKKPCESAGCKVMPSFNVPGAACARYCLKHKASDMVDVVSGRKCQSVGCDVQGMFNTPGEERGAYCKLHKLDNMVDVVNRTCADEGCNIRPEFNFEAEKAGLYCNEHKKKGMVNVVSRLLWCKEPSAMFNLEGQPAAFCNTHRTLDMVDVKSKRCADPECTTTEPRFGAPGTVATHCGTHRQVGHIFRPKRLCENEKCKAIATFGIHGPERCEAHRQPTDHDLVAKRCAVCSAITQWDEEKSEMCNDCAKRDTNIRLRRQRQVKAFLDEQKDLPAYQFYDKAFLRAQKLGLERPDFAWQLPTFTLFLENDEYQHKDRPCECEVVRMVNVTQATRMPAVWIRYNPDTFRGETAALRDRHRLAYLVDVIKQCLALPPVSSPQDFLRVTHLFFDDFDQSKPLQFTRLPMV